MNRADKRRRKLKANRQAASGQPQPTDRAGVPEYAPTPERAHRGDIRVQPLIGVAPGRAPSRDWTGDGADAFPRAVVMGWVRRDLDASVTRRLARYRELEARQIAAAARLERDWEQAQLEPRLIVDLAAVGSGGGPRGPADLRAGVLDARDRLHGARHALRRGGEGVVLAVEAVVMQAAAPEAGVTGRYAGQRDATVHARALLGVGLHLLADWYRAARS